MMIGILPLLLAVTSCISGSCEEKTLTVTDVSWRIPPKLFDLGPTLSSVGGDLPKGASDGWTPTLEFSNDGSSLIVWWNQDLKYTHRKDLPGRSLVLDTEHLRPIPEAMNSKLKLQKGYATKFDGVGWRAFMDMNRSLPCQAICYDAKSGLEARIFRDAEKFELSTPWKVRIWQDQSAVWTADLPSSVIGPSMIAFDSTRGQVLVLFRDGCLHVLDKADGSVISRGLLPIVGEGNNRRASCVQNGKYGGVRTFFADFSCYSPLCQKLVIAERKGRRLFFLKCAAGKSNIIHEEHVDSPVSIASANGFWGTVALQYVGTYVIASYLFSGRNPTCTRFSHEIYCIASDRVQRIWSSVTSPETGDGIRAITVSHDGSKVAILRENKVLELGMLEDVSVTRP